MHKPIDLGRQFFDVPKSGAVEVEQCLQVARALNRLCTWNDLLSARCSVVLGEAGSGKTTEFRERARICREKGDAAFFVPIEALASDGLTLALAPEDSAVFEDWRRGDALGTFFLDSLDEAKLGRHTLGGALRKLGHALGAAANRARLVVSCRVSDWDTYVDHAALAAALPATTGASSQSTEEPVRVFGIAPLNMEQVKRLAIHEGIVDPDGFMRAVAEAHAEAFVARPADVAWMARYWQENGRLGPLRDLVRANAREKLRDDSRPVQSRLLSDARAWEGAARLAGAATLSGRISFRVPGERHDGSGTSSSVDPGLVLQDWSPAEIAELLRLPLFDESTYGRVRIHERTAQEYLAADWLASLMRKGLPRKQLDGLLFRRTPHVATPVLAPHLRATTAWLALDDVLTQRRLIEIAPDVLLGEGDPSGIPVDERPRILTAYVEQFRGRRRVLDSLAEISLRRFGCASLADAINKSVPDTNLPKEVRRALLTIVAEGRIQACAATALQAATDRNLEAEVRAEAVTAASATVEGAGREALLALVREPNLDHSISFAILGAFFPVSMVDEDVAVLLLNSARKPQNLYTGLQFFFEYNLDRLCTHERRLGLARRLLDLMQEPARPDLRWLARSLLTLLRSILGGVTDGDRLLPQVEAAIDYFEEQQKLHHDFYLARQDGPASLLAGRPKTRRQLFWKRVRKAEKVKGSRITKFCDAREWYWLVELDAEDHQWLANDALAGEDEATRVLAFDALLWTRVRNGETAERTDLVRKLADQSPLLAQHLDRLARVRERDDGSRSQHVRKMQAIDARRAQQLDQSRGALEAVIEEIRSGKHVQALWHLYCVVGGPLTTKGGTNVKEIERLYGPRVAGAYPEGLKNYWRQASVPAPHEWHSPGQFPASAMLGLAGLSLEVAAGLRPSDLSPELRRLALRMALWEPNQPPPCFDDLAVAEPEEARTLLLPLLKQEFGAEGSEARVLRLDQIGRASDHLRALVAADITQELQAMEPKRLDVLQSALACIEGADASALDSLAPDRCMASEKEPKRLAIWLVAWMNRQGVAAADYLAALLGGRDGAQAGEIVEEVLSRMWTWADERLGATTFCIHKNSEALARLIPIAFAYVRRGEDLEHETTFSPGRRDHAQDMRDRLVAWLSSLPPQESLPQLRKLAAKPELGEIRDYLLHSVDERITADPGCAPWSPEAVVQWTQRFVREPSDSYELFHAVADVLEDIKDHAERGDHSNKNLFNPKTEAILEKFVQIELVWEMSQRAAGRFTAVPEEEVSTGSFPDIRAHKPRVVGAITVEVKVGERWSYEQLRTSIREQLVARYLRDPASKYGILLLASSGPRRSWETSDGTTLATFADLLAQLERDASQIAGDAGMKEVIVVGIDYH